MWSFKKFSISIGNTEIGSTLWLQWNEIQITKIPWYIVILDSYCKYVRRWIIHRMNENYIEFFFKNCPFYAKPVASE